jgi:hypothetical protein
MSGQSLAAVISVTPEPVASASPLTWFSNGAYLPRSASLRCLTISSWMLAGTRR